MLKESMYNIITEVDDGMLIYNTLSAGLLSLNSAYSKAYIHFQNTGLIEDVSLYENLKKGAMILEDEFDELGYIKTQSLMNRFGSTNYSITLAPTMKCNFRCPYCYEQGRIYTEMDSATLQKIKELISNLKKTYQSLSIAWYGGEPLLAFDIIKTLSEHAISVFGKDKYAASIVTNGYLFTEDVAKQFPNLNIKRMQITMDGPPSIHNKLRKLPNGNDTFFVILDHIKAALSYDLGVYINIRVNTDKKNIEHVDELLSYLQSVINNKNVGLYLAPIDNVNETCSGADCFITQEFANEQISFVSRNLQKGYNFAYLPKSSFYICGVVCTNGIVIDPLGDFYKCWDNIGDKTLVVGSVNTGFDYTCNLTKWTTYEFLHDSECVNCKVLPVCMGGCPHRALKNGQKRCNPIRYTVNDMSKILHEIYMRKDHTSEKV